MIKKDWVELPPHSQDYKDGVNYFLDIAFTKGMVEEEEILCPCAVCCNDSWEVRDVVHDHLCSKGFLKGYTEWIYHGEDENLMDLDDDSDNETSSHDDIDGLLFETFKDVAEGGGVHEGLNEDVPDDIFEIPLSELHNQKSIESDHSDTSYESDDEIDYDSSTD
ncbi:unnamed protein product [Lathyrus sativus]|nr:unnamed protein product [Lathyrus sativus]CAK8087564.1 unnamed protein product [Lathyrus sativus]